MQNSAVYISLVQWW